MHSIKTKRLVLRPWQEEDLEPFSKLNTDARVMEFFPSILSRQESDQFAKRLAMKLKEQGWGVFAVSVPGISEFIGYIGLAKVSFEAHFTPAVEINWRLDYDFWGQGYATEGARACLELGFETLNLTEIVSMTAIQNTRSQRVMEKIGMHNDPKENFDHPKLADHWLTKHVLYRIKKEEFRKLL